MIYRMSDKTGQLMTVHFAKDRPCKTVNNSCTQDSEKSYYERTRALNKWKDGIIPSTCGYVYT
jgi:hypothetical protein